MKDARCPDCDQLVNQLKQGALMNKVPFAHPFHVFTCEARMSTSTTAPAFDGPGDALQSQGDLEKIKRNQWGQPLIVPPGGGRAVGYQRVTTFIKVVESGFGLDLWKQRQVAVGLMARPDLQKAVQAHGPGYLAGDEDDKKTLDGVCKQALEAAASQGKATIGTALHRITERWDRGQLQWAEVPDWARADLDAYRRATDDIEWLHVERMTVRDDLKVAGTPDRIGRGPDGVVRVYDLKTGGYWPSSCATQLAVYANSQLYDVATGERSQHGAYTDYGVVIHLPAGSGEATLRRVDTVQGWITARDLLPGIHAWQRRKDLDLGVVDYPGSAYLAAAAAEVNTEPAVWPITLPAALAAATTEQELTDLAIKVAGDGLWTEAVRDLFSARKAALQAAA